MSRLEDLKAANEESLKKVDFFVGEILAWNKIHNLTGKSSQEEILELIYDSVYPYEFLPEIETVLDIGTGAGFPGLVLSFFKPKTNFILVEPSTKRTSFLNYIKSSLKLDNVEVKRARIEEVKPFKADLITSKAVSSAKVLYKMSKEFMTDRTLLLLYKGKNTQDEIVDFKNSQVIKNLNTSYLLIKK